MTAAWIIAAMFALLVMHNTITGYSRACPGCGGRERHHATCPYRDE